MTAEWRVRTTDAKEKHTATMFYLHGLGDTGDGWCAVYSDFVGPHVKLITPTAESNQVTFNYGMCQPSWFNIFDLAADAREDEEGIKQAAKQLQGLIEDEIKLGIPSNRILIGGFSQGGALALYTALTMEHELAGVLTMASWVPLHKSFPEAMKGNRSTHIHQCHGNRDTMVPMLWGQKSGEFLTAINPNYKFKIYKGVQHGKNDLILEENKAFINERLPEV